MTDDVNAFILIGNTTSALYDTEIFMREEDGCYLLLVVLKIDVCYWLE